MRRLGSAMGTLVLWVGGCSAASPDSSTPNVATQAITAEPEHEAADEDEDEAGLPDTVIDWNAHLDDALIAGGSDPGASARIAATTQTAVFDSVNGIIGRFHQLHVRHVGTAPARRSATVRAAAAQAAHDVLVGFYPAQQADLDGKLDVSINALLAGGGHERCSRVQAGRTWGSSVAADVFTWRAGDHYGDPMPPYTFSSAPGRYQLTPGSPPFGPVNRNWIGVTPFAIHDAADFRTPGPPSLRSRKYAEDVNESEQKGALTGSSRAQDQSDLAVFWMGNASTPFDSMARQLLATHPRSIVEEARILALLNVAASDAQVAIFTDKDIYDSWRPYTAITEADLDGNPATTKDAAWQSFLFTPPFPEYPAGHSETAGAATGVLQAFFGNSIDVTVETATLPGHARSFASFSAVRAEMNDARVFGGMHFRSACVDGAEAGRDLASWVVGHVATPVR